MKTVGVITHWGSLDNYGQTLQTYALQNVLEFLGYNPYLIRYIEDGVKSSFFKKIWHVFNPNYTFSVLKNRFLNNLDYKNNLKNGRDLRTFLSKHINQAPEVYSRKALLDNPPLAEVYITGSDQVWNKLDKSYFLDFVRDRKKISYAASFGGATYSDSEKRILYDLLKSFSHISVRESSGKNLCKEIGVTNANVLPDPTVLLSKDDYVKISSNPNIGSPYILIYMLGNKTRFNLKACFDYAKKNGLDIKYVAGQRQLDKYPKVYPTMEEWLGLIANAKYVVTNSFHGTVISTILNKPFISIPLIGCDSSMNGRIETFLSSFNLKDRLTNDMNLLSEEIDFDSVNLKLDEMRHLGIENLDQMIKN